MSRFLTKIAVATGLVAAIAAPLTLNAAAGGGLPLLGSGPPLTDTVTNPVGVLPNPVPTVTNTVNSVTQTVTNTVNSVTSPVVSAVTGPVAPAPAPAPAPADPVTPAAPTPSLPSLPTGSAPSLPGLPTLPGLGSPSSNPNTSTNTSNSSQAPPGTSSANALSVPLLDTCVSCTNSSAGPDSSSTDSNATALRILGHDVSAGHITGDNQSGSGNLMALPPNPLIGLAIADWMAQTTRNGDGSSNSSSRAALVDLDLTNPMGGPPVATLAIFEAGSNASWSTNASSGNGFTNGVNLNLGNGALVVILLHSESHSSNGAQTAHTFVASINGNEILSNTQIPQKLVITVPGIITISLLITNSNSCDANAAVGQVTDLLGMTGEQVGAFEVDATGCAAPSGNNGGGNNGGGNNGGGNNGGGNNGGGNNGGGNNGGGNNGGSNSSGSSSSVQAASTGTGNVGTPSTGVALGIVGFLLLGAGLTAAVSTRVRRKRPSE